MNDVLLAASGLGSRFGGVGVVAQHIDEALRPFAGVDVWRYRNTWPQLVRHVDMVFRGLARTALNSPRLVIYTHVDLSQFHELIPTLRQIPYAVFLHGTEIWRPVDRRMKRALEGACLILANSDYTARRARSENPWLPRVTVTWLGTSNKCAPSVQQRSRQAIIVGRMDSRERQKGHDWILDAWPEVVGRVSGARLVVVGVGDDRPRLQRRVEREGLPGICFKGHSSEEERNQLIAESSICLLPSIQEGFGLAAIEAAAFGLPVVGIRGTVVEEILPLGEGSELAEGADGPSVAQAVVRLLEDPARARAIGERGRQRVQACFQIEHFQARLRSALREAGFEFNASATVSGIPE